MIARAPQPVQVGDCRPHPASLGASATTLGILRNNGSMTPTRAIRANSRAHNAGANALVTAVYFGTTPFSDQRGAPFVRISYAAVDIGIYELQAPARGNFALRL